MAGRVKEAKAERARPTRILGKRVRAAREERAIFWGLVGWGSLTRPMARALREAAPVLSE